MKINTTDLAVGNIVRLGATTSWMKGLVDKPAKILAIDQDFCYVAPVDSVGLLISHKSELKLSEWEFHSISEDYLQVICPEEFWADTVEV